MVEKLVEVMLQWGPPGVIIIVLAYAYYKKDQALSAEYRARIDDNKTLAVAIEATNTTYRALEATSENRTRVLESTAESIKSHTDILQELRLGLVRLEGKITGPQPARRRES